MRQQTFCNVAEKNKVAVECAVEKKRIPPLHQERTKTQNWSKVPDTTKK